MQPVRFRVGGEALHGEHHAPPGRRRPRGGLLLVHGFNGNRAEFGRVPEALAAAGFHVLNFDQRGFGLSGGERGRTDLPRALADIEAAADELARLAGRRTPLGIVGHSLGGAYALAALGRTRRFRAGAVAHPVNRLFDELGPLERAAYHLLGRWNERRMRGGKPTRRIRYKVKPRHLFRDREAARRAQAEGLELEDVNLANYRFALGMDASAWAREAAFPVLCVLSPHDRVVSPQRSRLVYDALREPKALLEHRGGHSCFRDLDAGLVSDALVAWFSNHLEA